MFDFYIGLSSGIKSSLLIMLFLGVSLTLIGRRVAALSPSKAPRGILYVSVVFVSFVNDTVKGLFEQHHRKFAPLLTTILIYLLFANTVSLFGLTPPLTSISIALSFSLFAFGTIQIMALVIKKPKARAKDLLDPNPLFLPINLIGEIATPFSMGMRLFGNLLSGTIISMLLYGLMNLIGGVFNNIVGQVLGGVLGAVVGGFFLHPVFDVLFGAIQAYVYFILFSIFLSLAVEE